MRIQAEIEAENRRIAEENRRIAEENRRIADQAKPIVLETKPQEGPPNIKTDSKDEKELPSISTNFSMDNANNLGEKEELEALTEAVAKRKSSLNTPPSAGDKNVDDMFSFLGEYNGQSSDSKGTMAGKSDLNKLVENLRYDLKFKIQIFIQIISS
jgi:hypothetical protein